MNKTRLIVSIVLVTAIIGGMGIYAGFQGRYFGKDQLTHALFVVGGIVVVSSILALSEWQRARRRHRVSSDVHR